MNYNDIETNTNGLGCRRITKTEENQLLQDLAYVPTEYTFDGKTFENLPQIYKYARKNKITNGLISYARNDWGDVKSLLGLSPKEIKDRY